MSEIAMGNALRKYSLDPDSATKLWLYLSNVAEDSDEVVFDDRILKLFMERAKDPNFVSEVREYLNNLESPTGLKFARSQVRHADARPQLDAFLRPDPPNKMWMETVKVGFQLTLKEYAKAQLKSIVYRCIDDILAVIPRKNTSTGFTKFSDGHGWKKKFEAFASPDFTQWYAMQEVAAKVKGSFEQALLPITRGQVSGAFDEDGKPTGTCKVKLRYALNVALSLSVAEAKFVWPIEEYFLKEYEHSAIGKSDNHITWWVNVQRSRFRNFISLDYSKFDSTIPAWLIHAAFTIIRAAFVEMDKRLLDVLENDFTHKTLLLKGEVLEFHHGTASGSRFTSVVNGIVNEIISRSVFAKFGLTGTFMCMGDDNLMYVDQKVDQQLVTNIAGYISKVFGIECHPDKCSFGTHADCPEFLSRKWTQQGPWRPMAEILSLALFPERRREYWKKDEHGNPLVTPEEVFEGYWVCYQLNFKEFLKPEWAAKGPTQLDPAKPLPPEKLEALGWRVGKWYEDQRNLYLAKTGERGRITAA